MAVFKLMMAFWTQAITWPHGAFKFFVLYSYLLQAEHTIRYTQDRDRKIKIIINLLQSVRDKANHKKYVKESTGLIIDMMLRYGEDRMGIHTDQAKTKKTYRGRCKGKG